MIRRNEASERQVQAANPLLSTWLSANAGSGKTRVLTDRVSRLLLEKVLPQHILCLTYTKAAASEMQNRLFERLGKWAMQETDSLVSELRGLGVEGTIPPEKLAEARTLFARAIETPGGLKIQTIHSFCASILRRFPLEAGVSPQFKEMDDRAARLLRADVVEEMSDGCDAATVDALAQHYTDSDFDSLTMEITKHRNAFADAPDAKKIWASFGLSAGFSESNVMSDVFLGSESDILATLLSSLLKGSSNDLKAANKLQALNINDVRYIDLPILESIFLTATEPFTSKAGKFPTKATRADLGEDCEQLDNLMNRVETGRAARICLQAARKTFALHQFSHSFLPKYEMRKTHNGWLDFDDLINLTAKLLNDPMVAQWVLFRLDGGIDHILVDEAQDTSPAQWDVITRLTQEFTSGEGAQADRLRTIFVVGDKKQSIYSFQGADPEEFERMKEHFKSRLEQVDIPLQAQSLEYSFRSAEPILRLVDCTFKTLPDYGLGGETTHRAFNTDMPGRVDLWPVVPPAEQPEKNPWYDPTDKPVKNHHTIILAQKIAESIDGMLKGEAGIPNQIEKDSPFTLRRIRPGDILILVQRRSDLFREIIRACKVKNLPIAGADRLKIGAELAVKDLTALLAFLNTPEDSLSLAAALRSPLLGWSEQDLFDLASKRKPNSYLWAELRYRSKDFPNTLTLLNALRNDADYLRPYELLERILTRFNGRIKLLSRLGKEAEDGIDALLSQALAYERMDVPSLTGFLSWLQSEEVEIKRQMDSASDQIRVMTVHGAKGLEAPIVILPDTAKRDIRLRDEIYVDDSGNALWQTTAKASPEIILSIREKMRTSQAEESMRLLYVAMTRAEKWLIVCCAGNLGTNGKSWYSIIENGMKAAGATEHSFENSNGLRLQSGVWEGITESPDIPKVITSDLPEWIHTSAPTPDRTARVYSPSGLGGAKALSGEGNIRNEDEAKSRGINIHLLLEKLPIIPMSSWEQSAAALLPTLTPSDVSEILTEARAVLTSPHCKFLFNHHSFAEVPITATLPEANGIRIHGIIDRLLVEPDRVLIVDFKSNVIIPETPADVPIGLLRQMGAYYSAISQIYPDRKTECAILWTHNATLMPLEQKIVTAALRSAEVP